MSCYNERFTITRFVDNTFIFTIKQDNSTLPIEIVSGDTFVAKFVNLADDTVSFTKSLTVDNAASGRVKLFITSSEVSSNFVKERGGKEDRFYAKPGYKLVLECDTSANGEFVAKIGEVYVD